MTKRIGNSRLYILIFIGIVSAFGPFVTDFYLPALPVLSEYFDTTASLVQLSLTFSMVDFILREAKLMLRSTDLSVTEIADKLSFPNSSSFARFFRKYTGFSPVQFINRFFYHIY
jgi:hypothetical protein